MPRQGKLRLNPAKRIRQPAFKNPPLKATSTKNTLPAKSVPRFPQKQPAGRRRNSGLGTATLLKNPPHRPG